MDSRGFGAGNISLLGWIWREMGEGKKIKKSAFWEVFAAGILGISIKSEDLMEGVAADARLGSQKMREKGKF